MQGAAVVVLRALYQWSNRHYHREVLRRELWRIGRRGAAAERHRLARCRTVISVRRSRVLTPG